MQALLVQVGDVGPDKMRQALTAAQDLAVGLDVDLKTATLLVGKAFAGDVSTLSRYGIKLTEVEKQGDLAAAVLAKVQAKFGGQAAAEAQTFAGVIEQIGNAWGDVKEKIGEWLTQSSGLLTPMLAKINQAVGWMNDNFDESEALARGRGDRHRCRSRRCARRARCGDLDHRRSSGHGDDGRAQSHHSDHCDCRGGDGGGAWVKWGDSIKAFLRAVWAKMLDKIGWGLKKLSKFVGIFSDDWAKAMHEAGEGLEETAEGIEKAAKVQKKATKIQKAATKEQVKATKVLKKATKEQTKAEKAAEDSAKAVKKLRDSWTGATLKSGEFLRAFKKAHARAEEKRPHHEPGARHL